MHTPRPQAIAVLLFLILLFPFFWIHIALAQDSAPNQKTTAEKTDEKTIRALITQLGDDSFEKREAATKALAAIGLPAFELLRKAAASGADQELRERAAKLAKEMNQLRFGPTVKDKLWGNSVDPDGDCRFLLELNQLHIWIPGTPHRLGVEAGPKALNAPRVLQEIDGDFTAEVQIPRAAPTAREKHLGSSPWYGAGIVAWQDNKNYLRFERGRNTFDPRSPTIASWELRSAGKHARKGATADGKFDDSQPVFLKMERKGNVFRASYSQDGKAWKDLPPITADLTKKLQIGVCATHNTQAPYEIVFEGWKISHAK